MAPHWQTGLQSGLKAKRSKQSITGLATKGEPAKVTCGPPWGVNGSMSSVRSMGVVKCGSIPARLSPFTAELAATITHRCWMARSVSRWLSRLGPLPMATTGVPGGSLGMRGAGRMVLALRAKFWIAWRLSIGQSPKRKIASRALCCSSGSVGISSSWRWKWAATSGGSSDTFIAATPASGAERHPSRPAWDRCGPQRPPLP